MEYSEFDRGSSDLPGATGEPPVAPPPKEPREVFPVSMERDFKDFRGQDVNEEKDFTPKALSALDSAATLPSVTGMEDVSEEDLDNPVQSSVEKDLKQTPSQPPESGKPTSSGATSAGKKKQPAPAKK